MHPVVDLPLGILTDSYKASHYVLYPPHTQKMVAYGEFRQSFNKDPHDHRIVFYGLRYIIEQYVARRWTREDLDKTACFFATHGVGGSAFPFPRALLERIITQHDGWFPVTIEALPEGTHVPVYQITATNEFAPLCTCTVATLSRRAKHTIHGAFMRSVDPPPSPSFALLDSRLHDFGFRGCTSVEQSIIGGSAHLLNFTGTDTVSAAYHVQFHLNGGRPVGSSVPATEHSIMTAWPTEKEAILNEIQQYGQGVYACVMDSYDYARALEKLLPVIKTKKLEKGGLLVLRPDSGDPVETVLMALRAGEKVFGATLNSKGYKVLHGCAVIQGDAVTDQTLAQILAETLKQGYAAQNVAFGMGGGLLQKVNRDTMSFATKLSRIERGGGSGGQLDERDIMKMPKTDTGKTSLPGELTVIREPTTGIPIVHPKTPATSTHPHNMFKVVYDHGKCCPWEDFDVLRARVEEEWARLPERADVLSQDLKDKMERVRREQKERTERVLSEVEQVFDKEWRV